MRERIGALLSRPPRISERARFIVRNGVLHVGLPLGAVVFVWAVVTQYATTFEHLRTCAGLFRVGAFLLLCLGEWTLGAGWLVGMALWALRGPPPRHDGAGGSRGP
jgi:hypothetical protein